MFRRPPTTVGFFRSSVQSINTPSPAPRPRILHSRMQTRYARSLFPAHPLKRPAVRALEAAEPAELRAAEPVELLVAISALKWTRFSAPGTSRQCPRRSGPVITLLPQAASHRLWKTLLLTNSDFCSAAQSIKNLSFSQEPRNGSLYPLENTGWPLRFQIRLCFRTTGPSHTTAVRTPRVFIFGSKAGLRPSPTTYIIKDVELSLRASGLRALFFARAQSTVIEAP